MPDLKPTKDTTSNIYLLEWSAFDNNNPQNALRRALDREAEGRRIRMNGAQAEEKPALRKKKVTG